MIEQVPECKNIGTQNGVDRDETSDDDDISERRASEPAKVHASF